MAINVVNSRAEEAWKWLCRGLAVAITIYLLITLGLNDAPWGVFLLLLGLFFGPEVVSGQLQINRRNGNGNGKRR